MNILTAIVATGIPGFFSYVYLSKLGILTYTKDNKDEKVIVLSIFSFLNMGIAYIVYYGINKDFPFKEIKISEIILLFFISLIVSIIMTIVVYPFCINIMNKHIQKYQVKKGIANRSAKTVYELVFFPEDKKYPFVYIFDFENNFIESGLVYRLSGIDEKLNISITNTTGYVNETVTINEVLGTFEECDNDKAEMIIDVENKLKLFVFYS